MARGQRIGLRASASVAGLVLAGAMAAGCSGSGGGGNAAGQGKPGIEGGIDKIASTTGCTPQVQEKGGSGFRQAACQAAGARYTVMSFDSEADKQTWLVEAKQWGGTYLVGPKWVVVATAPILEKLQGKLGGDISAGSMHQSPNGG